MTVLLSMTSLYAPHQRLCGGGDEVVSPQDLTFNFVTSPPRADTPAPSNHGDTPVPHPAEERTVHPTPDKRKETGPVSIEVDPLEPRGVKRKLQDTTSGDNDFEKVPCRRISPFLNTPKQRKEERRKVLRISIQKLKQMEDPEHFLRRSVLINNTVKRMQSEIREEKKTSGGYTSKGYPLYKRKAGFDDDVISYMPPVAFPGDDHMPTADDAIADDMTDALVQSLETGDFTCTQTPIDNFTTDSQREKQIYSDMDTVFNNLIRALGET